MKVEIELKNIEMQNNLRLFSTIKAAVKEKIAMRSIVPEVTKTVEVG